MAVRVALLILVTGTFTALWSGDHPDQMAAVDRPSKVLVGKRHCNQECRYPGIVHALTDSEMLMKRGPTHADAHSTKAPLPVAIQAGVYLVVDGGGRTFVRVVAEQEVASVNKSVSTNVVDHFSVVAGKARWHYIRIDQTAADRMAISPATSKPVH